MPLRRGAEAHELMIGTTRAGKSVYTTGILERAPRYVVFDLKPEYHDYGFTHDNFSDAVGYLERHLQADELRLVFQARGLRPHLGLLRYVWETYEVTDAPPLLLVMDEAHRWYADPEGRFPTNPPNLTVDTDGVPYLRKVYQEGLSLGLVCLTVTQFPQQLPTAVRSASTYKVAFNYPGNITRGERYAFGGRVDQLAELEKLKPGQTPERGRHYLTYPADLDPVEDLLEQL